MDGSTNPPAFKTRRHPGKGMMGLNQLTARVAHMQRLDRIKHACIMLRAQAIAVWTVMAHPLTLCVELVGSVFSPGRHDFKKLA